MVGVVGVEVSRCSSCSFSFFSVSWVEIASFCGVSGSFNSKGAVESFSGATIFAGPVFFALQPGRFKKRRAINGRENDRMFRKFMKLDLAYLISQCNLYVSLQVVRIISDP